MSDLSGFRKGQELAAYVRRLLVEHPKDTIAARLWEQVRSSSELPTEIARELVRLEGPEQLRAAIARGEFPALTDLAAVATSVLRGEPVTDEETEALLSASRADLDLSAMLCDHTEYVPWGGGDGHDLQSLLDSPALRLDPRVRDQIDRFVDGPNREQALRDELMTAYQSFAMRHRGLAVNDPRTGEQASYLGYLLNADVVAYRFGAEADPRSDFYLLARGPAGRLRSVYLPDQDRLLDLSAGGLPILPRWPSIKAVLARALLAHADRNRARSSVPARRSEAELTIRVGGAENFAHVLRNFYGGLAREAELGTLSSAQKVLSLGSEFFGPLTEIYPEIDSAEITQRARAGTFVRHIDDAHQLLIPLGSTLLWPGVIDRVASRADALRDDPVVAELREQMRACPIRLYVALRVWDKSWVDAAEQLPLLIERLLRRHPDACVMLDGFSVPSGVDYATTKWTDQQEELRELIDTVRSRVAEPGRVLDLMGLDLLRSIAVLRGATCYLCPAGTAHHKIEWFTDIPGIVYVSEQLMRRGRLPAWMVRQASHEPRIVAGQDTEAADVRLQRIDDRRSNLANFTLSWDRVWAELAPLLGSPVDGDSEGSDGSHPAPRRPASDGFLGRGAPRSADDSLSATLTPDEKETAVSEQTVEAVRKAWREPDPFADFPKPSMNARAMFAGLHQAFRPRTYAEIGVAKGDSLARSRAKSIGVDPAFAITAELNCDVRLFRATSDDFFTRPDAFAHFDGVPVDFAYIDGMHLSEFALRDFMNVEKRMARTGVVALDDMLPRNPLEAARDRRTGPWAGDVYKLHRVLETYRPDLSLVPVNVHPTGTYLVFGLDPDSTVLDEHYDEIEATLLTPDPQVVAQEWLERRSAVDPEALLELDVWERLIQLRERDPSPDDLAPLWKRIASLEPASR